MGEVIESGKELTFYITKMGKIFARPLNDHLLIEGFLNDCLGIIDEYTCSQKNKHKLDDIIKKIRTAESEIGQTKGDPTFSSSHNRVRQYRTESDRYNLREKILTELITLDRLDDDDKITLGSGGAKPKNSLPRLDGKAYMVIGLPASGKSTLINRISDELGAIILDSDFAKRKLPEFENTSAGANLVHKESSNIVFGGSNDEPSLLGYCLDQKTNIVLPTIGQTYDDLCERCDDLIKAGYEVHLTATTLRRENATKRALDRFIATGRYVPLGLIFDAYANDPILNYYRARTEASSKATDRWASFGAVSTDTTKPTIVDISSTANPANLLGEIN